MRKLLVKILQLLDGTPAVYGKRQAGQSVVELALITPILIILLAGLIEIGWFANNYLNLLDVSRVGARRGAVLQDQKSPVFWQNKYSYVPNVLLPPLYQMANTTSADQTVNGTDEDRFHYRWMPDNYTLDVGHHSSQACDTRYVPERTFYSEVICTMVTSMDPLTLNANNGIDDIIVSGFSLQLVDPTADPTAHPPRVAHPEWLPTDRAIPGNFPQEVVVGRYPTNANECDVQQTVPIPPSTTPGVSMASRPGDGLRDPFDLNMNGKRDVAPPDVPSVDPNLNEIAGVFTELAGYDVAVTDPGLEDHAEKQVGFSLFGNHKIDGTYCIGSNWTVSQVQNLMNLSDYSLTTGDRKYLPSQGLVLVEIYWEHEMLLKIPVLSPVFTVVGNEDGKMVIYVWAAFPLSSVEPHIIFS